MPWHTLEDGATLGQKGSESGVITFDEGTDDGGRITIERDGSIAPWSITCGIAGWTAHTRFFSTESEAMSECERMKTGISRILEVISLSTPGDSDHIAQLIEQFVAQFP